MGNDYDKRHKQRSVTLNYVKLKFLISNEMNTLFPNLSRGIEECRI